MTPKQMRGWICQSLDTYQHNEHYGASISIDTWVRCVIGTQKTGYATYYKTLLSSLGCLDERDNKKISLLSDITRTGTPKWIIHKRKLEVKRRRKHGQMSKLDNQYMKGRNTGHNILECTRREL